MGDAAQLGATGEFPDGKVNPSDDGELQFGLAFNPDTGLVHVEFGKPVAWLAMRPEDAYALAAKLVEFAMYAQGRGRPS